MSVEVDYFNWGDQSQNTKR